ncbi:MAG: hypothetical protein V1729_06940 [Candidatus Woesearchaeota archaeon]
MSSNTTFTFYAMSVYNSTLNYNLTLDGAVNKTGTATNGTNTSVTIAGLTNGTHTWSVKVWDSNGANATASNTFATLTEVAIPPVTVPPIVNTSNSSGILNLSSFGVPASLINRTGVTGYEYIVTTNGSTQTVSLTVNVSLEAPENTSDISSLADSIGGFYYTIHVNESSWFDNVTTVQLRIYYDISLITLPSGVSESSLRPVRYTSGAWVRLDCTALGGCTATLADGTRLFASGVDTTAGYVWANLSRFSTYGLGGATVSTPATTSSGGGGGGSSTMTRRIALSETAQSVQAGVGDMVKFYVAGEEHALNVISLSSYRITVGLKSDTIVFDMIVGETVNVDLDEDGANDVSITYTGKSSGMAVLVFAEYSHGPPEPAVNPALEALKQMQEKEAEESAVVETQAEEPAVEVQEPVLEENKEAPVEVAMVEDESPKPKRLVWPGLFLVLIAGVAAYFAVKQHKKKAQVPENDRPTPGENKEEQVENKGKPEKKAPQKKKAAKKKKR